MIIQLLLELMLISMSATIFVPSSANDWTDIGSERFYYLKISNTTFDIAKLSCLFKGRSTRLVTIDSNFTLLGLRPYIQKAGGEFWINLHKYKDDVFRTTDIEEGSFFNWAEGEPDFVGKSSCVYLVAATMEMKDDSCYAKRNFICSIDKKEYLSTFSTSVTPPPTSVSITSATGSTSSTSATSRIIKEDLTTLSTSVTTVPSSVTTKIISSAPAVPRIIKALGNEWIDIGSDVVYSIENEYATWNEAVGKCTMKGINGRLASFNSGSYKSMLRRYIKDPTDKFWIGLRKDRSSGEFKRNGSPPSSYFDWAEGEPNNHNLGIEDCVELDASSMQWNDLPCDFLRLYICASDKEGLPVPSSSVMPPSGSVATTTTTTTKGSRIIKILGNDWIDIGSDVVYSIENSYATWNEAVRKCTMKGINGRLASFDSAAYKSSLRRYIKDSHRFWIGIHKDPSGEFKRTGSLQSSYFDWAQGEPNNDNVRAESCVELVATSMQWNDLPCDQKLYYICASDKAYSTDSENPAAALDNSKVSEDEISLSRTDIAEECHSSVIAVSFLIVFLFSVFLVALVMKQRYLPHKTISCKHFL